MKQENQFPLPKAFLERMERLLGREYQEFIESYDKEPVQGLRRNPLKWSDTDFLKERFGLTEIPWAEEGFYYQEDTRPGKHPLHEAGAYYIQEPSAMAVAELLNPRPGERVLDLCAAPGGKTTQIAGKMKQEGLLISNEIHPARARILSQNVERMGIANGVVVQEDSKKLLSYFPEFFDKIVVDAPCSGEGMFRKDRETKGQWKPEHVITSAARQTEILNHAAGMLKKGGRLVYSTCTFEPEENEEQIQKFLDSHRDFVIEDFQTLPGFQCFSQGRPDWTEGRNENLSKTFRIWPHKIKGEGHFLAVMRRLGNSEENGKEPEERASEAKPFPLKLWREFAVSVLDKSCQEMFQKRQADFVLFGQEMYLAPKGMVKTEGLRILRLGLDLGTFKKNRFEPSHSLALYLKKEQAKQWVSLSGEGETICAYLRGEAIDLERLSQEENCQISENGWVLILVDNCSVGWAKLVGKTLKNHYPKGLRR